MTGARSEWRADDAPGFFGPSVVPGAAAAGRTAADTATAAATSPAAERMPADRMEDGVVPVPVPVRLRFWLVVLARDKALLGVRDIKG